MAQTKHVYWPKSACSSQRRVSGGGGRTWSKHPLLWPVNPAEPWALLPQDSGGGQVPVGGFLPEKLGRAPTVSRWAPQGVEWGLRPWSYRQRNLS